jgi:hypothetical protein
MRGAIAVALAAWLVAVAPARAQEAPVDGGASPSEPDAGVPAPGSEQGEAALTGDDGGGEPGEPAAEAATPTVAPRGAAGSLGAPRAAAAAETAAEPAEVPPSSDPSVSIDEADPIDSIEIHVPTGLGHDFVLTIGGYVETGFTWSFNEPWNGLIAWRGFDNRHATFTLANVALPLRFELDRVYVAVTLQWGNTPDTYYLAEPADPTALGPASVGVGPSSAATWRFLQEAYFGWNAPLLDGIAIEGGLFLSPVGSEALAIRAGWHWSRTNLFYGLPFYHTGIRLRTPLSSEWTLNAGVFNGWNSVLDNNEEKSGAIWVGYDTTELSAQILYFGGVERLNGNWRSTFDAWVRWSPLPWLSFRLHGDAGFEPVSGAPDDDPVNWWAAGMLSVRVLPLDWLAIAVRADVFADHAPGDLASLRIFWPTTPLMASQTVTLQLMPDPHVSFFVEYRHDHAEPDPSFITSGSFFDGTMPFPGGPAGPTSNSQDTLTLGATAGF